MTSEVWAKVRALVETASALSPDQRPAYLAAEAPDAEVRAHAERLLAIEAEADEIFATDASQWSTHAAVAEANLAGRTFGHYRLIEELGRGGMGAVYLAERADGAFQKRVALKVLQESIFTPRLVERFEEERHILARLSHPGIARLLDGGVTPDGRPYLVLEYVDGRPLDRYCDEENLNTTARLQLFLKVANAVQSAHQQLVLHLDLKPANILVTSAGEPVLLDFGISRMLGEGQTGAAQAEATLRLLTPRYASPEQIAGAPLGVASDIFSLTTVLYRILTGRLPYEIESASTLEAARMVCEQAPLPPSQAATIAETHGLRGDIDTILLQGLRKEPERRYPTVAALANDIERHLASKPVLAHADSFGYRAGKFLRRNRVAVSASAAMALVVIGSGIAVLHASIVARRERAIAERRLADVRKLAHVYIFDVTPRMQIIPGTVEIRQELVDSALQYLEAMSKEGTSDPAMEREIAGGYYTIGLLQGNSMLPSLGDQAKGLDSLAKGLAVQKRIAARDPGNLMEHGRVMMSNTAMANIVRGGGDIIKAQQMHLESWSLAQPIIAAGPRMPKFVETAPVAWFIGTSYSGDDDLWNLADPAEALRWFDRAEALRMRWGNAHPEEASDPRNIGFQLGIMTNRARALRLLGRDDEALDILKKALAIVEQKPIRTDNISLSYRRLVHESLARLLLDRHDFAGARALLPALRPEEFHELQEKGHNAEQRLQLADATALFALVDLRTGEQARGLQEMNDSLNRYRVVTRDSPERALAGAQLAHQLTEFAEVPSMVPACSRAMLQEAITIANAYARAHPGVLSANLLIGRAEFDLAGLDLREHHPDLAQTDAATAVSNLTIVTDARPNYPAVHHLFDSAHNVLDSAR